MSGSSIGSPAPWNPSKPTEDQKSRAPSRSISSAGTYARELEDKRVRAQKSLPQAPPSQGSFNQPSSTDQEPHAPPTKSVSSAGQYAKEFASQKLKTTAETQAKPSSSHGLVKQMTSQQSSERSACKAELRSVAMPSSSSPHHDIPLTYPKPTSNSRRTDFQPQTPSHNGFKVSLMTSGECTKWSTHVQELVVNTKPLNLRSEDEQKLGPTQKIQASSNVTSPSAPQTTVEASSTDTTMSLAEWISPYNAMPHSFGGDEACLLARDRIIKVALKLTKAALKRHRAGELAYDLLSPQNITLIETRHPDKPTTYECIFDGFTPTTMIDAFKAPWLRRIPKEAWISTMTEHKPSRSRSEENNYQLGIEEAHIWSLGAIFWAMCEGGVSFMNEPYNIENFIQEAGKRVKSCEKWKFFALILACLQETDGDEQGVPNPRLRIHSLQKICDFLETKADEVYEDAGDVYAHWTQMKDYIRV